MARYSRKDLRNVLVRATPNNLSCLWHLKIVKNQNDKKVISNVIQAENISIFQCCAMMIILRSMNTFAEKRTCLVYNTQ